MRLLLSTPDTTKPLPFGTQVQNSSVCSGCWPAYSPDRFGCVGYARKKETEAGRLTISRIPRARLTPSSSIYETVRMRERWQKQLEQMPRKTDAQDAVGRQRIRSCGCSPPSWLPWQSPCSVDSWFPVTSTSVLKGKGGGSLWLYALPLSSRVPGAPHLPTRSPDAHTASQSMPPTVWVLRSQTAPKGN